MKKHLQLLLLFISFHTYAQHSDFEKVSTHNKWKVDVKTMKPNMLKSICLKTEIKGKYITKENSKILELNFESGEVELYKIVSFYKNKIHLYSDARSNDLVLIPAN